MATFTNDQNHLAELERRIKATQIDATVARDQCLQESKRADELNAKLKELEGVKRSLCEDKSRTEKLASELKSFDDTKRQLAAETSRANDLDTQLLSLRGVESSFAAEKEQADELRSELRKLQPLTEECQQLRDNIKASDQKVCRLESEVCVQMPFSFSLTLLIKACTDCPSCNL